MGDKEEEAKNSLKEKVGYASSGVVLLGLMGIIAAASGPWAPLFYAVGAIVYSLGCSFFANGDNLDDKIKIKKKQLFKW